MTRQGVADRTSWKFNSRIDINGQHGPVHIEPIFAPAPACPEATVRAFARWSGLLPRGAVIQLDDVPHVVLRMFPTRRGMTVAHFYCVRQDAAALRPV